MQFVQIYAIKQSPTGDVACPGATVTVYQSDGVTLATIYLQNGTTPQANPMTADATGLVGFAAPAGKYVVKFVLGVFSSPNYIVETFDSGDPADRLVLFNGMHGDGLFNGFLG